MNPTRNTSGYIATIVSGLVGALIGGAVGIVTANLVTPDDLSGLGVALIWLILLASLGAGAGVAVGLTTRSHLKPWLTAVLAAPAIFIVSFGALVVLARIDPAVFEGWVFALVGWGVEILVVTLALAGVRGASLAMSDRT